MEIDFAVDPAAEDFRTNCAEYYARLQRAQPICRTDSDQWLFCRYADVRRILTDHRHFARPSDWSIDRKPEGPLKEFGKNNMINMNPPEHTRFRQCAARGFTAKTVRAMAPRIEKLVDKLLDQMAQSQGGDFITEFAFPLPVYVICEMMGISYDDHDLFGQCTARMLASLEMAATPEIFDQGSDAAKTLFEYIRDVARHREGNPGDDLISLLIASEREDRMARDEVIWTAVTMLIAGHETTTHMLGNGLLALIRNPDQLQKLMDNPQLSANATEETLRYDPTLYVLFRQAIDDVEFDGQAIPSGSFLIPSLYAANRDPEHFDVPDSFDIERHNAKDHLTFAAGRNLCLGHALARMEGQIAFAKLFRRIGEIELTAPPVPRNGLMFRGNLSIPLAWKATD